MPAVFSISWLLHNFYCSSAELFKLYDPELIYSVLKCMLTQLNW